MLIPDFEVMKHSRFMKVGQGGQVVLTNEDVRVPERSRFDHADHFNIDEGRRYFF